MLTWINTVDNVFYRNLVSFYNNSYFIFFHLFLYHTTFVFQGTDIWSMGVTLYAFMYGKVPFHDDNIISLYNKIQHQPVDFPENPKVSDGLKDLIRKMLEKDANNRITLQEIKVDNQKTVDIEYFINFVLGSWMVN